jgi:hypothetical protein
VPHLRRDQSSPIQLNVDQVLAALDGLESASLTAGEWDDVAQALDVVMEAHHTTAAEPADQGRLDDVEVRLWNLAFTNQVRSRLGGSRRPAPVVAPTKQSPALPLAGLVCGAALLVLGWLLGGGIVLLGTAALAIFVVGIAVAGTTSVADRRRPSSPGPSPDLTIGVPTATAVRIDQVRQALTLRSTSPPEPPASR